MNEPIKQLRMESRSPVGLAIVAVLFLLIVLPGRVRLFPAWYLYIIGAVMLLPMVAVTLSSAKTRWLIVERGVTLLFVAMVALGNLAALAYLINAMIVRSTEMHGLQLLTSGVAVWVANVLMFSLLYWQIDRGGPGARASGVSKLPDLFFTQEGATEDALPPGWEPTYVDYLFFAFSTATAFSTTDVLPLTHRAKMMMMIESMISLVTTVVVAARAINVLGS